jgi:hypothetical protein
VNFKECLLQWGKIPPFWFEFANWFEEIFIINLKLSIKWEQTTKNKDPSIEIKIEITLDFIDAIRENENIGGCLEWILSQL